MKNPYELVDYWNDTIVSFEEINIARERHLRQNHDKIGLEYHIHTEDNMIFLYSRFKHDGE